MGDVQGLCDDDVTVQQFCSRYVEPMGEESDHIQLVALTDALLVRTHTWESQPILGHAPAVQYSIWHWMHPATRMLMARSMAATSPSSTFQQHVKGTCVSANECLRLKRNLLCRCLSG